MRTAIRFPGQMEDGSRRVNIRKKCGFRKNFRAYLLRTGITEDQIIALALDEIDNAKYRNPFELNLMKIPNADIYVTGSNSKMLSTSNKK